MIDPLINPVQDMIANRSSTVQKFGLDQTGLIDYHFNAQGFRSKCAWNSVPDFAFFGCSMVFGTGMPETEIFPSLFNNSHNYGLAGFSYKNSDVMEILQNFLDSDLFSSTTKIVVVWHHKHDEVLPKFYQNLKAHSIKHFFCGASLGYPNCHKALSNLDSDISGTHGGPKTHQFWYRVCRSLFAHY